MPSIQGGDLDVTNEEPLKRELADFVDAVASRRAPAVTGEDGRRALALAQQITDRMTTEMQPRKHEDTKTDVICPSCFRAFVAERLACIQISTTFSPISIAGSCSRGSPIR